MSNTDDPVAYGLDALHDFVTGRVFTTNDGKQVKVQAVETVDTKTGATTHVETTAKAGDSDRRSEKVASERLRIEHVFSAPKSTKHKRTHPAATSEDADTSGADTGGKSSKD